MQYVDRIIKHLTIVKISSTPNDISSPHINTIQISPHITTIKVLL